MAAPEPLLTVRGLVAGYGKKVILQGVQFAVERGEVVALLGANGSGKSTAMNTISGFVRPWRGSIVFDGEEIAGLPPHKTFRRGIVQVSQTRDLFPDLLVEDNLHLGAAVWGGPGSERRLQCVYEYFPRLNERRNQRVSTMSGGEQQMVTIGRALMSNPKILLMDEPSGGLAPQFVNEIGQIILRLKETDVPMLLVEQNIKLALKVADRFIVLRDGMVIDGGDVAALKGSHEDIVRSIYL